MTVAVFGEPCVALPDTSVSVGSDIFGAVLTGGTTTVGPLIVMLAVCVML